MNDIAYVLVSSRQSCTHSHHSKPQLSAASKYVVVQVAITVKMIMIGAAVIW